ncbi:MAG TPA: redoxin domain-containing protein [Thermoanaerobaculia bacterium]|nr:redoxin domain-containing protein [Thermoanaerobaculia bacterium]
MDSMMRSKCLCLALAAAATFLLACDASAATIVGEPAPGFTLPDLADDQHSLSDHRGKVVVLEWINPKCPFSERHAREQTMSALADMHEEVVWLAINSTNPDSSDYLEPAEHLAYNGKHGIDYAVLYDTSGDVGRAYDAKTTPQMYIIDETGTLLYNGAIDDDPLGRQKPAERTNYVAEGLAEHAQGSPVDPATTKPYGCSVKY